MAWTDYQTFETIHSFHTGVEIGAGLDQESGGVPGIPSPFILGDSFEWTIRFFEHYTSAATNTPSDFENDVGTTATLYAVLANVEGAIPVQLDQVTADNFSETDVAGKYNGMTFQVTQDTLVAALLGSLTLYIEINDGSNHQRSARQALTLQRIGGDSSNTPAGDALIENVFTKTATVDYTATGQTTLFTVPTGYKFIATRGTAPVSAITGSGTPATQQWGESGDTDALSAPSAASADAVDEADSAIFTNMPIFTAGEVVQFGITVASTYTTHTGLVALHGFLIEA